MAEEVRETFNKTERKWLIKWMSKEFLEDRLGVETTPENIRRFAAHIIVFEREVEERDSRKKTRKSG